MNIRYVLIPIVCVAVTAGAVLFLVGKNTTPESTSETQAPEKKIVPHVAPAEEEVTWKGEFTELAFPENTLDTSDWETYRNEEFGFEVRYPKEWGVRSHEYPKGLFAFYHGRGEGSDNGIYINARYYDSLTCDAHVCKEVMINNLHGYFIYKGIPKTQFNKGGAVLKNAHNDLIYSLYVFEPTHNPGDLDYVDVFQQMLLSLKSIK